MGNIRSFKRGAERHRKKPVRDGRRGPTLLERLFEFMTQPEWKLCYAVIFVCDAEGYQDTYPLTKFATPDQDAEQARSWVEAFRQAIRYYGLEAGWEFAGLRPYNDGRIVTLGNIPLEPNNRIYQEAISLNLVQHHDALAVAIRLAGEANLKMNLDPMIDVYNAVQESRGFAAKDANPEALQEWTDLGDRALAEMGIEREPEN